MKGLQTEKQAPRSAWVVMDVGYGSEERHWQGLPGNKKLIAGLTQGGVTCRDVAGTGGNSSAAELEPCPERLAQFVFAK